MKYALIILVLFLTTPVMAYDYEADRAQHQADLDRSNTEIQNMNKDFIYYQGGSRY